VRLACALIAAGIIGYNRGEHGKAAGLRTTLLVCLAAAVAMLQVNALLPLAGRGSDSFVMNDLMRLPLGILTGVGFIGAGAILRRREVVTGVTTAATLWYVTVIGLCFGADRSSSGGSRPRSAASFSGHCTGSSASWSCRSAPASRRPSMTAVQRTPTFAAACGTLSSPSRKPA